MDKYEYKLSLSEIKRLVAARQFEDAAQLCDTIEWNRVRTAATLCMVSDIYKITHEVEKSRRVLILANSRQPGNPDIIYSLCEVTIFLYGQDGLQTDLTAALQLLQEYQALEPNNPKRLVLQYKMYNVSRVSLQERIAVLEQLRSEHFSARWGYELAKLYDEAGMRDQAVQTCEDVVSAFHGRFADRAGALLERLKPIESKQSEFSAEQERETGRNRRERAPQERRERQSGVPVRHPDEETGKDEAAQERQRSAGVQDQGRRGLSGREETKPDRAAADAAQHDDRVQQSNAQNSGRDAGASDAGTSFEEMPKEEPVPEPQADGQMSIGEVMDEWEKIRRGIRSSNDEKRAQRILQDTGPIMQDFDETAKHGLLEDIEKDVDRRQRRERSRISGSMDDGLTKTDKERAFGGRSAGLHTTDESEDEERPASAPEQADDAHTAHRADVKTKAGEGAPGDTESGTEGTSDAEDRQPAGARAPEEPAPSEGQFVYTEAPSSEEEGRPADADYAAEDEEPADADYAAEDEQPADADYAAEDEQPADADYAAEDEQPADADYAAEDEEPADADYAPEDEQPADADYAAEDGEPADADYAPEDEQPADADYAAEDEQPADADYAAEDEQRTARQERPADRPQKREGMPSRRDLQSEESPEEDAIATRRWNAAAIRRAMAAQQARVQAAQAELDEEARAEKEKAGKAAAPAGGKLHTGEDTSAEEQQQVSAADAQEPSQEENPQADAVREEKAPAARGQRIFRQTRQPADSEDTAPARQMQGRRRNVPLPAEDAEDTQPEQPAQEQVRNTFRQRRETVQEPADDNESRRQDSGEGTRALTKEEAKLFGPFCRVRENRQQLSAALEKISLASYTGNVLISGNETAAQKVAQGILEIARRSDPNFTGRIAKAPADALNRLSDDQIRKTFDKIENGALLVERASLMTADTVNRLYQQLEGREHGIIVILMDTRRELDQFTQQYKDMLKSFNARVDVRPLSDKALVQYGKDYALSKDYSIDEFGELALAARIGSMQSARHHVTLKEVRDMVDEAISYASRKSLKTLIAVITGKRYDADDRIILHEKDFTHY